MADQPGDTSVEANQMYLALLQQRSGAERMRMASEMFDAARRLVLASLPESVREDPAERSCVLLLRFYGRHLQPAVVDAALAHFRRQSGTIGTS